MEDVAAGGVMTITMILGAEDLLEAETRSLRELPNFNKLLRLLF
jgi:hypothetical protein